MRALLIAMTVLGFMATVPAIAEDAFGAQAVAPSAHPFQLGRLQLIALHDAQFVVPNDGTLFGTDVGTAAIAAALRANGLPDDRVTLSVNALLVRSGPRLLLLDTGIGPTAQGALLASLQAAGIAPQSITDVLITHSHSDHVGGLLNSEGQSAFPHAVIRMGKAEWAWLQSQDKVKAQVQAIAAQVQAFTPGQQLAPGVRAVELAGHTPGHSGYALRSGSTRLLDIGDMAHSAVLSLQQPEWTMSFDRDAAQAKVTRRATLARLARQQELVFAPHFPFPGIGHIAVEGGAFRWVPTTSE